MGIRFTKEGFLTTIQDDGRYGYQSLGFSTNGVMDQLAMKHANLLVNNNNVKEAVLEMSIIGPSMTFEADMVIALTGADMSPKVNHKPVPLNKPLVIQAGDRLDLHAAKNGVYTYLAISGGFDIADTLNSKSTALHVGIGGFKGRAIQTGDYLPIRTSLKRTPVHWGLSSDVTSYIYDEKKVIHYIEGRQYDWFTDEAKAAIDEELFQLTPQSNRMGFRLTGPMLEHKETKQLLTEATTFGTIQVPPSGEAIILMADRQPTGGYPKIGQVIQDDLPKLSQIRPGQTFHFVRCTLEEAQQKMLEKERQLNRLQAAIQLKWKEWGHAHN
ncbi:biotin-dependent carboxyltransferase family protein [Aquibacillus koreensis]|uniref:Biotin-dependent carboxyltransferase family protein n=1 Tax=Aquibacillus koreensis TaxID=279446 RepID=A0A9X3WQ67_9BACI|nr:biotin-dependent carboxyltransferase family protein [Aquibacillus koreensis]MCT2537228.1 biotin-dependent carboxyltransferase family protein [Aquibacillus koreensis]MDC3421576.1 biotin-dependent carboxyltransferase family protein [Aquibacillus koreensis]